MDRFDLCIDVVQLMLRNQLVAACGKVVEAADFERYMNFHQQQIITPAFAPRPFCHAVGRTGYQPEGYVSIESTSFEPAAPIETLVLPQSISLFHSLVLSYPHIFLHSSFLFSSGSSFKGLVLCLTYFDGK